MKVKMSSELSKIYAASHKNWNYSLNLLLGSLDLETSSSCFAIIDSFVLSGQKVEIEVDDPLIEKAEGLLNSHMDHQLIEKLIWIAAMLPEV